jgi:hypothetical protein
MPISSACAQWQFSSGAGIRQVRVTETGKDGQQLVREQGWLPGLELRADYVLQDWRFSVAGEAYRHDIGYDGRLQNGTPFSTDTETALTRVSLEVARQLSDATRLIGAIEWDRWQRHILGHDGVLGLDERSSSWRLLAGAETRLLQSSAANVNAKALLVVAQPEKLRVRIDNQLFDDTDLSTKSAIGTRLAVDVQPAAMPNLSFGAEFDWLRISRSDNAVLRKNGVPVGLVTQPEHQRSALGVRVNYRF